MPQILETNQAQNFPRSRTESYTSVIYDGVYYPEEREDDMGETSYHISLITDFLSILKLFFKQREDIFLSANMNIYYEKGNPHRWLAPDLLIAFGVPNVERSSYLLFREKVFPQVIFEIASEKTWRNDVLEKLDFYSDYGAEEYYIFDPEFAHLPAPLMAFHRQGEKLIRQEIADDKVFSLRLGLEIIRKGNTFRFFNPQTNEFLRTLEESENELERLKAEIERLKAEK
jgi:Uma2 family endonuclease